MSTVIGHTTDGREILRHDPSEGCEWRCTTCGNWLAGRSEVRGHWLLLNEAHSIFVNVETGRAHHQTVEGLHERDWVADPPTNVLPASPGDEA